MKNEVILEEWYTCNDAKCRCDTIVSSDERVCIVTRGDWGDEFYVVEDGEVVRKISILMDPFLMRKQNST